MWLKSKDDPYALYHTPDATEIVTFDKEEVSTVQNQYDIGGYVTLKLRRGSRPDIEPCGLFFEREDWARDPSHELQECAFGKLVVSMCYLH